MTRLKVAVTTTPDGAERMCAALLLAEFEPVLLPCIEIRPAPPSDLARLRRAAGEADLIVLTSARPVRLLWPRADMPAVPAAVVGPGTARAVERAGGEVATVGEEGGDRLLSALVDRIAGKKVVFPHSGSTDPSRLEALRDAAGHLVAGAAYDTVPIAPGPTEVDAALFASPSAVRGWILSRRLDDLELVGAIGPTTAAALSHRGRPADVVPDRPSVSALVTHLSLSLERKNHVPDRS